MTAKQATSTFIDSDGDVFKVADIRREMHDSGAECLMFTVSMNNGDPVDTLEWIEAFDEGSTAVESNLWVNHRRQLGEEAYDFIAAALASWLAEPRQVTA